LHAHADTEQSLLLQPAADRERTPCVGRRPPARRLVLLTSGSRRTRTIQAVELIEFGRLSDEQYAELVGDEDDPWHAVEFDLKWLPKDHHIAVRDDDGRLLAAAGLVVVEVQFGAQPPVPVVGVGSVIVNVSNRGRGLGRQVISAALVGAEAIGPEIAMLFCRPAIAGLYRRHGFAEVGGPVLVDQPDGVVEMSGVTMWRPLKPGGRLPDGIVKLNGLPF
jgi:predicted GNAT family N-acyltransferase